MTPGERAMLRRIAAGDMPRDGGLASIYCRRLELRGLIVSRQEWAPNARGRIRRLVVTLEITQAGRDALATPADN